MAIFYIVYGEASPIAPTEQIIKPQAQIPALTEIPNQIPIETKGSDEGEDDNDEEPSASDMDLNFDRSDDLDQQPSPSLYYQQGAYNQEVPTRDLKTAASHHHKKHGAKGWLDMGAWTGKKGAFGWYDKHPVGKGK